MKIGSNQWLKAPHAAEAITKITPEETRGGPFEMLTPQQIQHCHYAYSTVQNRGINNEFVIFRINELKEVRDTMIANRIFAAAIIEFIGEIESLLSLRDEPEFAESVDTLLMHYFKTCCKKSGLFERIAKTPVHFDLIEFLQPKYLEYLEKIKPLSFEDQILETQIFLSYVAFDNPAITAFFKAGLPASSLRLNGGLYTLFEFHYLDANIAWVLANVHQKRPGVICSLASKDNVLSTRRMDKETGVKPLSDFSVEIYLYIQAGYQLDRNEKGDTILIPPAYDTRLITFTDLNHDWSKRPCRMAVQQVCELVSAFQAKPDKAINAKLSHYQLPMITRQAAAKERPAPVRFMLKAQAEVSKSSLGVRCESPELEAVQPIRKKAKLS